MPASPDPAPFSYPPESLERRHGPDGYKDYLSYRPWLRDEFSFRCVYCLVRERWGRVTGEFDLDHFIPQVQEPAKAVKYANLLYACHTCNLRKGQHLLPDASSSLTAECVRVYADGTILPLTADAERIIRVLCLNSSKLKQWRRLWVRIVELAEQHDDEQYRQLMGYPDDLPDLSACAVPSNAKKDGIAQSCFARRERGELPETYLF